MTSFNYPLIKQIKIDKFSRTKFLSDLPKNPWFAYSTIFILQLKVIWNIWQNKDLTYGDTSGYYYHAWTWYVYHKINLIWSPLYTLFYGSLLNIIENAYAVTILHRMIIVLAAALLILTVMRRLLPPAIAWFMAAWWVVLPVNFNALYEVHQFAILPILIILFISFYIKPGSWARGIILTLLLATTLLVRNEIIIAFVCFAFFCLMEEWKNHRNRSFQINFKKILLAYIVPFSFLCLLLGWFVSHSLLTFNEMRPVIKVKHTLNMAQVYAFGYQQRQPGWNKNPWTEPIDLIKRDFGLVSKQEISTIPGIPSELLTLPSLGEMIRNNPTAVATHFLWNIKLLPSGLQLLLFDRASGKINPDYAPVKLNSKIALYLSSIVILTLIIGIGLGWRERDKWYIWFAARKQGWATMLVFLAVAPAIILTQRPRPEYLYFLSIFLLSMIGMSLWIILSRWSIPRWLKSILPLIMITAIFWTPSYYKSKEPMSMLNIYEHLKPLKNLIDKPKIVFLSNGYPEVIFYLVQSHNKFDVPKLLMLGDVLSSRRDNESLIDLLNRKGINLFYLDETGINELENIHSGMLKFFLLEGHKYGWQMIGYGEGPHRWFLFKRDQNNLISFFDSSLLTLSNLSLSPFQGWYNATNILPLEGPYPELNLPQIRWAIFPSASTQVKTDRAAIYKLSVSAYPAIKNIKMSILVDDHKIATHQFSTPGKFDDIDFKLNLKPGEHKIEFHFSNFIFSEDKQRRAILFRKLNFSKEG